MLWQICEHFVNFYNFVFTIVELRSYFLFMLSMLNKDGCYDLIE